jgi:hypothetical protein
LVIFFGKLRLKDKSVRDRKGRKAGARVTPPCLRLSQSHPCFLSTLVYAHPVRRELAAKRNPQFMFIDGDNMYIDDILLLTGSNFMATATKRSHKHFQLDSAKIKRAQRALQAKTETEAIERALDFAIAEHEKNRLVQQATERFIKSGIEIQDVYDTQVG